MDTKKVRSSELLSYGTIIGESPGILELIQHIKRVAPSDHTAIIYGETGVGKELVARTLHEWSCRSKEPFAAINCTSIPPHLFESELFGHERGSFTGAHHLHKGAFEQANKGTLFLDEMGELPLTFQAKLLRALESHAIRRVGGKEEMPVDIRIIAATHRNLHEFVKQGKFRADLYYRIHVVPLYVPPLRERREDIPLLAKHFVQQIAPDNPKEFSRSALRKLMTYDWPGNVRELKNVISRSLLYCTHVDEIRKEDIHFDHAHKKPSEKLTFKEIQNNLIEEAYQETQSIRLVAKILGIGKSTVQRKLKKKTDLPVNK